MNYIAFISSYLLPGSYPCSFRILHLLYVRKYRFPIQRVLIKREVISIDASISLTLSK
jgi:hypothetical protein